MDKYSVVPLLISLAKLSGGNPPHPPLSFLLTHPCSFGLFRISPCVHIRVDIHVCAPGRTLPFVGHHLLWTYYVLVCVGIKGWADGY